MFTPWRGVPREFGKSHDEIDENWAIMDNTNSQENSANQWGKPMRVNKGRKVIPKVVENGIADMGSFIV